MKKEYKLISAFCANGLIVILEAIALILSLMEHGLGNFLFYTQDSNYLAMAASMFFCIYAIKKRKGKGEMPKWVYSLRYIAVSCLMVTFFVVLFVLMPMAGENALFMLYGGSMLYQHTICPLLAMLSFFVFEIKDELPGREILKALIPTLAYALIAITLNICKVIEGPYLCLMGYAQPWYASGIWGILILGIEGVLAFAVWRLHNYICKSVAAFQVQE